VTSCRRGPGSIDPPIRTRLPHTIPRARRKDGEPRPSVPENAPCEHAEATLESRASQGPQGHLGVAPSEVKRHTRREAHGAAGALEKTRSVPARRTLQRDESADSTGCGTPTTAALVPLRSRTSRMRSGGLAGSLSEPKARSVADE